MDDIQFKGFMADSAQANWNAVQIVYGGGDPTVPMEEWERTCLFHWMQSLEKHTKADIRGDLQEQHRQLCKQWRMPRFATLLSKLGGYPLERQLLKACKGWSYGCPSGTFVGDSGAAS